MNMKDELTDRTAMEEALKCLLCHDAPCAKACRAEVRPDKIIRSIRFGNPEGIADAACGSCVCEKVCSRIGIDKSVEIKRLHQYAAKRGFNKNRAATKKDLSVDFLGVHCENPFFLASSPVGGSYEMVAKAFKAGWGGVFFKTIGLFTANECSPRFAHFNNSGLPWTGFKNMEQISDKPAVQNFENIRRLKKDYPGKVVVASIMGSNEEEWITLAKMCEQAEVDLIEGNFSCPQMTSNKMGSDVGTNPELVKSYCKAVSGATKIPFIAKMTPNVTEMETAAIAAIEGGAAGIAAINTIKSITSIDFSCMAGMPVVDRKSSISGYSGAAVKPIALRFIAELKQNVRLKNVHISGIGGIETWRDAVEFLLLGCRNIQVSTAVMQYGYRIVEDMISGMGYFMDEYGFNRIDNFIGLALPNIVPAEEINRNFQILPDFNLEKCIGCGRCHISCFDAAHQAIEWDAELRKPKLNIENCVGCHLCINVCPVQDCVTQGETRNK